VDIPDNIKNQLEIVPVKWIDKVLELALERKPEPIVDAVPVPPAEGVAAVADGQAASAVITH